MGSTFFQNLIPKSGMRYATYMRGSTFLRVWESRVHTYGLYYIVSIAEYLPPPPFGHRLPRHTHQQPEQAVVHITRIDIASEPRILMLLCVHLSLCPCLCFVLFMCITKKNIAETHDFWTSLSCPRTLLNAIHAKIWAFSPFLPISYAFNVIMFATS